MKFSRLTAVVMMASLSSPLFAATEQSMGTITTARDGTAIWHQRLCFRLARLRAVRRPGRLPRALKMIAREIILPLQGLRSLKRALQMALAISLEHLL